MIDRRVRAPGQIKNNGGHLRGVMTKVLYRKGTAWAQPPVVIVECKKQGFKYRIVAISNTIGCNYSSR